MPPAKKMDYQTKESKTSKGGKLSDMFVPEQIPLKLIRTRDHKSDNPFKMVEEDNVTEEDLDKLRQHKDREQATQIEKEQRLQA